jgi:hypothetical protein
MGLVQRQHCLSSEPWFEIVVPSQSEEDKFYHVKVPYPDDEVDEFICECLGFVHRGHCIHQEMVDATLCQWTELDGPEVQSKSEKKSNICPRCGGETKRSTEWQ